MIFTHIVFWHWWILAAVLLIVEMATWTVYCLWIALASAVTGLVKYFFPHMGWEWQFVIFAVLTICSLYLWWRYNKCKPLTKEQKSLNRRNDQLIDQVITLSTPIQAGRGKAKVGDSLWLVSCDHDLPAGSKVKVVSVESTLLKVEKFDA